MISGLLNVVFFAFFFHYFLKDKPFSLHFEGKPFEVSVKKSDVSNAYYLSKLSTYSFRELVFLLSDKTLAEEGYSIRDLALGCLVSFHDFNLEKALANMSYQRRKFDVNGLAFFLFPGLNDYQYETVIHYAYNEKWPLTAKGMFKLLEKSIDKSLENAFMTTKEFTIFRSLFDGRDIQVSSSMLLQLLCELRWETIDNFCFEQKQIQDLSTDRRRRLLFQCLEDGSQIAALLLLQTDFIYVCKKTNDVTVLRILDLLSEKNEDIEQFCVELLKSSRSDDVWEKSAKKLYGFANETMSSSFSHTDALKRFVYSEILQDQWKKEPKQGLLTLLSNSSKNIHLVQEGENLWKIARAYKVEIDHLLAANQLESDKIFPGMELIIPTENTR